MTNLVFTDIKSYQNRVNNNLADYLNNINYVKSAKLIKAISYSTLAGGKRFRAILVYLVAKLFNTTLNKVDSCACAIEFIHTYSLIHDDLPAMDNDDTRHNKPSCHIAYGESMAILAGDALQTMAFDIVIKDDNLDYKKKLAILAKLSEHSGCNGMVAGQDLDLHYNDENIDINYLEIMYKHKTASLIRCAVAMGVISSNNYDDNLLKNLDNFAINLGLAYQIQDDVLDITTIDKNLGKKQYSDINNNKTTYPSLLGLDKAKNIFLENYDKALAILDNLNTNNNDLQNFIIHLKQRSF